MKYKIERIKKLISQQIMKLITEKTLNDPRIPDFITITKLTLSKDLHYCHVYFSTLLESDNTNKIVDGLNNASGFIQKVIARNLGLKYTPKIEFRYDDNEQKAYQMDELLNKLSKERNDTEQES